MAKRKPTGFRAMSQTGKHFVADAFFDCLKWIADTLTLAHENVRVIERDTDS